MSKRLLTLLGLYLALGVMIVLSVNTKIPSFLALPVLLGLMIAILAYTFLAYVPPAWARLVRESGKQAPAVVLKNSDFKQAGFTGSDRWVSFLVLVKPAGQAEFEAHVKARLSYAVRCQVGAEIKVRYDPLHKDRVLYEG